MLLPLWLMAGLFAGVAMIAALLFLPHLVDEPRDWWWIRLGFFLVPVILLLPVARRIGKVMKERDISSNSGAALVCFVVFLVGLSLGVMVLGAFVFRQ